MHYLGRLRQVALPTEPMVGLLKVLRCRQWAHWLGASFVELC
jgi:hypothetical protein